MMENSEHMTDDKRPLEGMTYYQRAFGCQMNENDAERVCGMLEDAGCLPVATVEEADIAVYLTCCVREKADTRLFGTVASLKNTPAAHEGTRRLIAVGGCIGQRDGSKLQEQIGHIDVVFGTHNLGHLVDLLSEAIESGGPVAETISENDGFSSDLPVRRSSPWHAWLPIMTGCNNFCTYCIVPYVRGREMSRDIEAIKSELFMLAGQGVKEVTLLGQNVNSYGRDRYGEPRFAEVLEVAGTSSIPRVRFVTSHPKDLSPQTIETMAAHESIMPQLHLPLQSGSDAVLKAMNRVYDTERYLDVVGNLRSAIPDIALSTDIIVGFPGETEEDFQATYDLVEQVGYSQVFTFIYSKREGTPAATWVDDTPREVVQDRFDRLVDLVQKSAWQQNQKELGKTVPVLVEGPSRRDPTMFTGKSPKNQTVHAPVPDGASLDALVGNFVDVQVDTAKTWYLQGSVCNDELS